MPANDLGLSLRNPILVYSFLALYGLLTVLILAYVQARFRVASKTLKLLQTEWTTAESRHADFVGLAQERLSKLSVPKASAAVASPQVRTAAVGSDTRNQVISMAKRGIAIADIARNCGLHEGEVEVIVGMARLQQRD